MLYSTKKQKRGQKSMEYSRRYLMDGLHNLRDLGGYTVPGGVTRFGVLLRRALPRHLTEDDGARFAALGIRHTLDLRDVDESETMPDELALLDGVSYRQIAMKRVPRAVARNRPGGLSAFDDAFFWGDEYVRMLEDNRPWAKECAEFLAAAEGTVLFHCFTGKDRTGILAALILGRISPPTTASARSISDRCTVGCARIFRTLPRGKKTRRFSPRQGRTFSPCAIISRTNTAARSAFCASAAPGRTRSTRCAAG